MSYGVIIHYGLYSYYAYDNITSAKRRTIQNGSEWYYGRLIDKGTFRPISGHESTKKYYQAHHGETDYFDNIDKMLNDRQKIKQWVKMCKDNGASKHIYI